MVVAAVAILATACSSNLGLPDPVTTQGTHSRDLWRIFVVLAIVIGAIVYALVGYVLFWGHQRRGDDAEPSQRQYNVPVEVVYTALPIVIVGVLLGLSIRTENKVTATSDHPDLTVQVIGFQWQWQFRYQGSAVVVTGVPGKDPVLVLPVGRTVRLELQSPDVIHSFWVPNFIEKRDLIPRVDNAIDVNITQTGQWPGVCSEFCGLDHTSMRFSVQAVPPDQFDQWLARGGTSS